MKIAGNSTDVEISGATKQATFGIKASAKAYQILSSGLYSDKILAVVRELSCNAYDAHVAANNTSVPFYIHAPTRLEPWFSIRDYGTGLSQEDVLTLYSTYFESTKSESNDFTGAFGLGSKSPFAYTNTFEVTSWHNGYKTIYTIYQQNGMPTTVLLHSEKSKEPNGIEVKVVTKTTDEASWHSKIADVAKMFPVMPKTNITIYKWEPDVIFESVYDGVVVKIVKSAHYKAVSSVIAVQGNVAYPVDLNVVFNQMPYDKIVDDEQLVAERSAVINKQKLELIKQFIADLNGVIYLYYDIGSLDVAASREGLSYDTQTLFNIQKTFNSLKDNFVKQAQDNISGIIKAVKDESIYNRRKEIGTAISKIIVTNKAVGTEILAIVMKACPDLFVTEEPLKDYESIFNSIVGSPNTCFIEGFSRAQQMLATKLAYSHATQDVFKHSAVAYFYALAFMLKHAKLIDANVNRKQFDTNVGVFTDYVSSSSWYNSSLLHGAKFKNITQYTDVITRRPTQSVNYTNTANKILHILIDDVGTGAVASLMQEMVSTNYIKWSSDDAIVAVRKTNPKGSQLTDMFPNQQDLVKYAISIGEELCSKIGYVAKIHLLSEYKKELLAANSNKAVLTKKRNPAQADRVTYVNGSKTISIDDIDLEDITKTTDRFIFAYGLKVTSISEDGRTIIPDAASANINSSSAKSEFAVCGYADITTLENIVVGKYQKDPKTRNSAIFTYYVVNGKTYDKLKEIAKINKNVILLEDFLINEINSLLTRNVSIALAAKSNKKFEMLRSVNEHEIKYYKSGIEIIDKNNLFKNTSVSSFFNDVYNSLIALRNVCDKLQYSVKRNDFILSSTEQIIYDRISSKAITDKIIDLYSNDVHDAMNTLDSVNTVSIPDIVKKHDITFKKEFGDTFLYKFLCTSLDNFTFSSGKFINTYYRDNTADPLWRVRLTDNTVFPHGKSSLSPITVGDVLECKSFV